MDGLHLKLVDPSINAKPGSWNKVLGLEKAYFYQTLSIYF